jgi:hypothetical protein
VFGGNCIVPALTALCLFVAFGGSTRQSPIRVEVTLVRVPFSAMDAQGVPVRDPPLPWWSISAAVRWDWCGATGWQSPPGRSIPAGYSESPACRRQGLPGAARMHVSEPPSGTAFSILRAKNFNRRRHAKPFEFQRAQSVFRHRSGAVRRCHALHHPVLEHRVFSCGAWHTLKIASTRSGVKVRAQAGYRVPSIRADSLESVKARVRISRRAEEDICGRARESYCRRSLRATREN